MEKNGKIILITIIVLIIILAAITTIKCMEELNYCHSIGYDGLSVSVLGREKVCVKKASFNESTGYYTYKYAPIPEEVK